MGSSMTSIKKSLQYFEKICNDANEAGNKLTLSLNIDEDSNDADPDFFWIQCQLSSESDSLLPPLLTPEQEAFYEAPYRESNWDFFGMIPRDLAKFKDPLLGSEWASPLILRKRAETGEKIPKNEKVAEEDDVQTNENIINNNDDCEENNDIGSDDDDGDDKSDNCGNTPENETDKLFAKITKFSQNDRPSLPQNREDGNSI